MIKGSGTGEKYRKADLLKLDFKNRKAIYHFMSGYSLNIIPPLLCLITGYSLAVISLVSGKLKKENILLALICVWWTLLSIAFIYHYAEKDQRKIMVIEKIIHSFYVFAPVLTISFFQVIAASINKLIILLCFILSLVLLFFVHTPYYFDGFNTYQWGIIARGGVAFQVFTVYGIVSIIYILFLYIKKIRNEKNIVIRLKFSYLFAAFFISAFLTATDVPAIMGIDFYPLSNFIFIPLVILTYGVLKYRLIRISSFIQTFISWVILSFLITVPNILLFIMIQKKISHLDSVRLVFLFLVWFYSNYYYFNKIQPLINYLFNKRNYTLAKMKKIFIKDMAMLKNLDELVYQMITMLRKTLFVENATLYIRRGYSERFMDSHGNIIDIDHKTEQILQQGDFFDKSLIEAEAGPDNSADILIRLFNSSGSEYIVPLSHQKELIAVLTLSGTISGKRLKENEVRFIYNLNSYATIALANSVMYQNLSDMKDNLESLVEYRTAMIERQKADMESDIQLARKIQMSLLPADIPETKKLKVAFKYEPIMGVGGDFIDIHFLEGMNEYGLFICDVSGHGSSSAMIATMIKMALHSWGDFIRKPAQAFIEIKNLLRGKIGDNFITAFMCCIDLNSGIITSACAGHPPMVLIRQNGEIELIKPPGRILLDIIDSEYTEIRKTLYDGDKVVLYTDGVIETKDLYGTMIGEEKFIQILKNNFSLSAENLCQKIYDEIYTPPGNIIDDDFALLVAEYKN